MIGQESTKDTIRLLPDEREALVEELGRTLNLRRIGWIFTDLIADDVKKGTVKHVRNIESHFLSAQECIMAGYFQNRYPNLCRFSPNGLFGSKFVTVCVTGKSILIHDIHNRYFFSFKNIKLIKSLSFFIFEIFRAT